MSKRTLQRKIHVACTQLGYDQETRHDIQLAVTNKASMSDMTETDLKAVISRLEADGWTGSKTKGKRHKTAPRADLRYVHVLWTQLGKAEKLKSPGRAGLNAFVRSRFENNWQSVPIDIDSLRDAGQINDVTRALKDWCMREGIQTEMQKTSAKRRLSK
ncbi:regulatory protein GemA [Ascidiaceihabitans sp.]|uniref:regulatory protein GemA n=1 Tax=Ascidiaceihabitans sp. TaxID=1872644 RepID=UPI003296DE39